MSNYLVSVEKRLYCTGHIKVDAENPDQAISAVRAMIDKGLLQTTEIKWNEPEYEDSSFDTTGDIDEA